MQIINQPVKYALEPDGKRYLEVHQPLSHSEKDDPQTMPIALTAAAKKFMQNADADRAMIKAAMARRSGMPVLVNKGEKAATEESVPAEAQQTPSATSSRVPATVSQVGE